MGHVGIGYGISSSFVDQIYLSNNIEADLIIWSLENPSQNNS